MAFLGLTEAMDALAAVLKVDLADLPAYWTDLSNDALAFSESELVSRLLARGYTIEQVQQFDHRGPYQKKLFLWSVLSEGAGLQGFDDKFIRSLDVRKSLDCITLSIGGKYVVPDQGTEGAGTASHGSIDTSDDLVSLDPDDGRRGQATRF